MSVVTTRGGPLNNKQQFIRLSVLAYLAFATLWILLSDQLLTVFVTPTDLIELSTAKGLFFICASAAVWYLLMQRLVRQREKIDVTQSLAAPYHSNISHYIVACALVISVLQLRILLPVDISDRPMMIVMMFPIVVSALLGGFGPGLLATFIAASSTAWMLGTQIWYSPLQSYLLLQWFFLLINGIAVSWLSHYLRKLLHHVAAQRRLLDSVIEGTDDAIFVKSPDGKYQLVNRATTEILQLSTEQMLGKTDDELFAASVAAEFMGHDQQVLASAEMHQYEEYFQPPSGQAQWFSVLKGPIFDHDQQIVGMFGISRNITALKQQAAALQQSQQALQETQNLAKLGGWRWDIASQTAEWTAELFQIHQRDPALGPIPFAELKTQFIDSDWQRLLQAHQQCEQSATPYELEVQMQGVPTRWLLLRGVANLNDQGHIYGLSGTAQDISQRKAQEQAVLASQQQLQRALEGAELGFWDWDLLSDQMQVCDRWLSMIGYQRGDINTNPSDWPQIVHPEDLTSAKAAIALHLAGKTPLYELEFRAKTKSGDWRWLLTRGKVVAWDDAGIPIRMSGTHTDVHERRLLAEAGRQASVVFDSCSEGIMVTDHKVRISRVNPAFCKITGYSAEEVIGKSPAILSSEIHDRHFYQQVWQQLSTQGLWRGEIINRRKDGTIYTEMLSISKVPHQQSDLVEYIGIFSDISKIKAHEAELKQLAHYDTLTGAANRRLLSERFNQAIIRAVRQDLNCAVCMLDLDGFKAINDYYGHLVGDQLLIHVTRNLEAILRPEDTLARLGGDEFVVLLSDMTAVHECNQILQRMLLAIAKPMQIDHDWLSVSASIGVSLYPIDNSDPDTLLRHADKAMFQAKEAGKNRVHWFDPQTEKQLVQHRMMLDELQDALNHNQFVMFYQPKVNMATGEVYGAEALIRWQHPERGLLAPGAFLSFIEGSNLEVAFGQWVIKNTLRQAAIWQHQGLQLVISLNISANHLLTEDFCRYLQQELAENPNLDPRSIELEVLESTAISDIGLASAMIKRCQSLGFGFALDDFGTGYSSLTYLRQLPIQTIKIDQSFVRDMLIDPDDLKIIEGVIQLALVFDRQVVAEGVETLEHGKQLLALGCQLAQGYGVAKPLPAAQLPAWIANWSKQSDWQALTVA